MSDGTLVTTDNPGTTDFEQRASRYSSGVVNYTGRDEDARQAITAYYAENPASPADKARADLQAKLGSDADTLASIDKYVIQNAIVFDSVVIKGDTHGTGAGSSAAQLDGAAPVQPSSSAADPVDLATGQFVESVVDVTVAGAGIDFIFARTYRSGAHYFGPLGINWDHSYNLWLRTNADNSVSLTTGRLRETRYQRHQKFSDYYLAVGEDAIVAATQDNTFELRSPNGRVVGFARVAGDTDDTIHRVEWIRDRFGNALTFAYDGRARLSEVQVNHVSRTVAFAYDDFSRVVSITLFPATYWTDKGPAKIERKWAYTYDDFSDLVSVSSPPTDEFPAGRTTRYSYSSPASVGQRQHDLLRITDGNAATYLENEFGDVLGTAAFGKVVRQRLGSGVFLFDYSQVVADATWNFAVEDQPYSSVTIVQRDGHPVRYVLNALGNILASEETILGTDEQTVVWRHAYDGDGRRKATMSPEGRVNHTYYGREDFYRRTASPGTTPLPMWQDPNLSVGEHARFSNVVASVKRVLRLTLTGLLDDLAIYGDVFPDIMGILDPGDVIVKNSYEATFQQLASVSDPRFTTSADPAAAEGQDPNSPYSKHLTVMTFNRDSAVTLKAIGYPDTYYPVPLPDGSTGVVGATQTFESYDANGRLQRWASPVGVVFAREYFASRASLTTEGFLASSTIGFGTLDLRTAFEVNEAGQVVATTDPLGNTTRNSIDTFSLVRIVAQPITDYAIKYAYDGSGQLVSRTTAIIDPDGSTAPGSPEVATFAYNDESSIVLATLGDSSGIPARRTGRVYNPSNRLIRMVKPRGNWTCLEYDARSLVKSVINGCCEPEAAAARYGYDLDELRIAVTDPLGNVTSTRLDALGRPVETVDGMGNLQRTEHDKLNNPLTHWQFGARTGGVYPLLRRIEYEYDERGHLIRIREAYFKDAIATADPSRGPDTEFAAAVQAGHVELYDTLLFRDAGGRIFRVVDALGNASTVGYDAADREVVTTDALGNGTNTTYDAASNVKRQDRYLVDSKGATRAVLSTAYDYDPLNRLTSTTDGAGNRVAYGLDSRGLVRVTTDPLGQISTSAYNGFRELVSITQELRDSSGAVVPLTTFVSPDLNGNPTGIVDPLGNCTKIVYDSLDRPIGVTNPDGSARAFEYDRNSNMVRSTDEDGVKVLATYDALNQLTKQSIQLPRPGPASAELSAEFAYDGAGTLVSHANEFLRVAKRCDSLGRCYEETLMFGAIPGVPMPALTIARRFDELSNRVALTYPSGQALTYGFDQASQLVQLKSVANAVDYPGDPAALPNRSILERQRWGSLSVDGQFGNGVTMSSAYDAAGRRIADVCSLTNGDEFQFQQLWNAVGNRSITIESNPGATDGWLYRYDSINRLTGSQSLSQPQPVPVGPLGPPTAPAPVTSWKCQQAIELVLSGFGVPGPPSMAYDAGGNRVVQIGSGGSVAYKVNERNEYTSVDGTPYRYDLGGRLVDTLTFTFSYNYRGQLVQAVDQSHGNVVLQIFHDATGRPIGIIEADRSRILVIDGANPLESYDNGRLSAVFVWEGDNRLGFVATSGKDLYILRDVLDSTRLSTDSVGAIVDSLGFDSFGSLTTPPPAIPILYGGCYLYGSIGWYEYRARQYIPGLGRFAQPDPAGFVDGPNPYTFVGNNPLSAIDPLGTNQYRAATPQGPTAQWPLEDFYANPEFAKRLPVFPLGEFGTGAEATVRYQKNRFYEELDASNSLVFSPTLKDSLLHKAKAADALFQGLIGTSLYILERPGAMLGWGAQKVEEAQPGLLDALATYPEPLEPAFLGLRYMAADFREASLFLRPGSREVERFMGQGYTRAEAHYLAQPYVGMGEHVLPRRWNLPTFITESQFNVLKPAGISRGRFYELHYFVDRYANQFNLSRSAGGGVWSGARLGLEKFGLGKKLWFGTTLEMKLTAGGALAGGAGAVAATQSSR